MTRDEHIELSKGKARERIASARALIDRIENHGMRFHQSIGGESMREITDETLGEQHQKVEQSEELLRMYEADRA